jgi:hypothetical protein
VRLSAAEASSGEPLIQHLNSDGEVSLYLRAAFVNDAYDSVLAVKERTSGHAWRQLLRYLNQSPTVLNCKRVYLPNSNVACLSG